VPWFAKAIPKIPHINARAETVHVKALFPEAFQERRALIPATGFEWQKRADGNVLSMVCGFAAWLPLL
jgi:putative SOS response-associated peptidase YedK